MRKIITALLLVAAMLTVGTTGAQAARVTHGPGRVAHTKWDKPLSFHDASLQRQLSASIGTHIYLKFNRKETAKIIEYGTDAAAAAYVVLICSAIVVQGNLLGGAICAAGAVVVSKFAHDITSYWYSQHQELCLTGSIKYIPFTSASTAYFRYC